jgi:hypothetical protein
MHTAKKKEKPRYYNLFLVGMDQTSPRQQHKFTFFKSDASKKKTMHKHRRRPDHIS